VFWTLLTERNGIVQYLTELGRLLDVMNRSLAVGDTLSAGTRSLALSATGLRSPAATVQTCLTVRFRRVGSRDDDCLTNRTQPDRVPLAFRGGTTRDRVARHSYDQLAEVLM